MNPVVAAILAVSVTLNIILFGYWLFHIFPVNYTYEDWKERAREAEMKLDQIDAILGSDEDDEE